MQSETRADTPTGFKAAKPSRISRLITFFGILVSLLAAGFVVRSIMVNWQSLSDFDYSNINLWGATGSVVFYALCIGAAALNWTQILKALAPHTKPLAVFSVFVVAQLGRYLPGNVGHYFGRVVLGRSIGIPLKATGIGSLIEILSALAAGALIFICAYLFVPNIFAQALEFLPPQVTPLRMLLTILVGLTVVGLVVKKINASAQIPSVDLVVWSRAIGFATTSLMLTGISFTLFLHSMTPITGPQWALTLVVFSMAWLAGFVTPGAPAGLGVREAVILAFLTPVFGPAVALGVSILHRLLCTIVDLITSALGWLLFVKAKKNHVETS
ncbi:MAG: uncharacterized membrane protein YbhN (UPF0104 family) [Celeribacter sp.]|jgi:uncharacterized membrane protein YbhN (UPF0104 family)